ncbi:hypothetical protein NPIL_636801, partial [Nephila pilipes]
TKMASRLFQHIGKELVKPFGRQIVAPQCAGFHPRKPKPERKSKRLLKFIAFILCYSITYVLMETTILRMKEQRDEREKKFKKRNPKPKDN